jgi:hypothetical protein
MYTNSGSAFPIVPETWDVMQDTTDMHQGKGEKDPMLSNETNGRFGHERTRIGEALNLSPFV